ncbi:flagellar filament capping protein FliD [Solicola sp. PLA-1-18]|uniref:flagellar filament capping protein FliD n=1 Tax=Solicola sp. PLA-1-18 TaxID=3380532 RepID=UPI003B7CAEAC
MATSSISGLVSGLDTTAIVSKLMQVEAAPQTLLKNKRVAEQSAITSLQALNAKVSALATAAGGLSRLTSWNPVKASTSGTGLTATVTGNAAPGTTSVTVQQTARQHRLEMASTAASTDVVTGPSTSIRLVSSTGTVTEVDTGDGTLAGLVSAVNSAGTGVRASTVRLDDGSLRLRLESTTTGDASAFSVTDSAGGQLLGGSTVTAGRDAAITIGSDTLHSATNTFSGVLAGLDLTVASGTAPGTVVDVAVTADTASLTTAVKTMVDAANAVLAQIRTSTSYDAVTKAKGPLSGDAGVRDLRDQLLSLVGANPAGTSMATYGVQLTREGTLTFDEAAFTAKATADPAGTAAAFAASGSWSGSGTVSLAGAGWRATPGTHPVSVSGDTVLVDGLPTTGTGPVRTGTGRGEGLSVSVDGDASGVLTLTQGFAARLAAFAERASNSSDGSLTTATAGRNRTVSGLTSAIDAWDQRLSTRQQSLERQYAALEVSLSKLQNQSQWLSGQLAQLSSSSS